MKLVTGHSKPKAAAHAHTKGRHATHMSVERAENGVMVSTHHEAPKSKAHAKSGMSMSTYEPPEKHMFNDMGSFVDHMTKKMGDVLPGSAGKPAASAAAAGGASDGPETEEDTPKMS